MRQLTLPLLAVAAGSLTLLVACDRALPTSVGQSSAPAPLVLDLDPVAPVVVGSEMTFTLRGPSKARGERGGATASFTGNGGPMCVIVDPENTWDSTYGDDGDADLFVGRSADYTGQPGDVIGDFHGIWVDDIGIDHDLDENLCIQKDRFGSPGAHAGLGTPEFCTIPTDAGTPYTLLSFTFSVPENDDMLTTSVRVSNGGCPAVDETTLTKDEGLAPGFNAPPGQ